MATKVYIVYYLMYGHVEKFAEEIKKGADSVGGVEAKLRQVPETMRERVLGIIGAPPKSDVPIITPNKLVEADGIIFGFPIRGGNMATQFEAFMDATGGLRASQKLAGKPAGIFYSTGSQGGGQETALLTAIAQLTYHGSPYGAGNSAGDGSRMPSDLELGLAFLQGKCFAHTAKKFKGSA